MTVSEYDQMALTLTRAQAECTSLRLKNRILQGVNMANLDNIMSIIQIVTGLAQNVLSGDTAKIVDTAAGIESAVSQLAALYQDQVGRPLDFSLLTHEDPLT